MHVNNEPLNRWYPRCYDSMTGINLLHNFSHRSTTDISVPFSRLKFSFWYNGVKCFFPALSLNPLHHDLKNLVYSKDLASGKRCQISPYWKPRSSNTGFFCFILAKVLKTQVSQKIFGRCTIFRPCNGYGHIYHR